MDFCKPDPDKAGFSAKRLENVARLLDKGVKDELYPGGVLWAARRGVDALVLAAGHTDFSRKMPVDEHTLFDLASLTKPIATAASTLLLCQDGEIHLCQSVTDFFPDRRLAHLSDVTLRHLLTHTSGLPAWKDLYSDGQTRDQAIDQLFGIPLEHEPGTHYTYSCMGYIMLGLVIERASGLGMDEFARTRIFEPLGMTSTTFSPGACAGSSIAATDHCPLRKRLLVGEVHDGNAYVLGGAAGNAGLFSNIVDLARFCRSVLRAGEVTSDDPFGPAVINLMLHKAIPEDVGGQTIGWFCHPNDMLPGGDFVSKAAIGHSGFTGTAIIIDPTSGFAASFLTNRVCRDDDGTRFRHFRRRIYDALLGSVVD